MNHNDGIRSLLRPVMLVLLILFVPSSLYTAYWTYAAATVRHGIDRWVEARRADGYQVHYEKITTQGFPLHLDVEVQSPSIQSPSKESGWRWQSASLDARLNPFYLNAFLLNGVGTHEIRLPKGTTTAILGTATANVRLLANGSPEYAHIKVANLKATNASLHVGRFTATGNWSAFSDHDARTFSLSVEGGDVDLPPSPELLFGPRIEDFSLQAELNGTLSGNNLVPTLNNWRQAGGTVEIRSLAVRWPPVRVHANGTMALDNQLQPIGALTANIQGFFEAVESLTKAGTMRPRDASMAKVVLGGLAKTPANGGAPTISVPLTIQDRILYAGPVTLIHMPDVRWSDTHKPKPLAPTPEQEQTP